MSLPLYQLHLKGRAIGAIVYEYADTQILGQVLDIHPDAEHKQVQVATVRWANGVKSDCWVSVLCSFDALVKEHGRKYRRHLKRLKAFREEMAKWEHASK